MKSIVLKKSGYDPFIDFLKGFCILSVILTHCLDQRRDFILFHYWGELAVPLFLILQSYHVFRRDYKALDVQQIKKMIGRIFLPFAFVTAVEIAFFMLYRHRGLYEMLRSIVYSGGIGPGSYYFWVYLQFFFIIPFVYYLIKRFNINLVRGGVIFTFISELMELVLSFFNMPDYLYRLSCFRYIYLIFLGMVWSWYGIRLNTLTIGLSAVSIIFITLFRYMDITLEPLFYYSNYSWEDCHWICYFYPAFLFMFLLKWGYNKIGYGLRYFLIETGHYSWEIYLAQLAFFAVFKSWIMSKGDPLLTIPILTITSFIFTTIPVIFLHRVLAKILRK